MDYSTLPTALIYQQKTLDKISELHELNRIVLNNLLDIETLHDVDFENFVLPCFNNAYYICTMMRMEKNAAFRRNSYKKIALNGNEKNTLMQCVTLSLVSILNEHCSSAWREKLHSISNELKRHAMSLWIERQSEIFFPLSSPDDKPVYNNEMVHLIGIPEAMSREIDDNIILPEELFAPRHIDEKTLVDMDRENHHFEWANWTKYYDEDIVRELVEGLGTTQQDKAMLIRSLMEKSDSFYLNDYPKQHVEPLLKSLAEEFCPDCLQMTNLYSDESTETTNTDTPIHSPQDHATAMSIKDSEQQSIIEQQASRIKELKAEVDDLNQQLAEQESKHITKAIRIKKEFQSKMSQFLHLAWKKKMFENEEGGSVTLKEVNSAFTDFLGFDFNSWSGNLSSLYRGGNWEGLKKDISDVIDTQQSLLAFIEKASKEENEKRNP